ncbi:MAG: tetratricopeptide repeat protein [Deltaproteobacteria bacterium]|nr:tetratricopeptide repeat protein [Deltaproteobacteria bacterium]
MNQRLRIFALAISIGLGSLTVPVLVDEAVAQSSRREEKKREVLDYKQFEREQNRAQYGELANEKRQEAIAQLKKILAEQTLPPDTKAEMLMRLAELYWEQSKYEFNTEMKAFDKEYEKWFDLSDAQQKKTPEPKVETTRSSAFTRKAIENYRIILQNYPNYPRVDEALFFLAFSLNDIGENQDALSMYSKLVKSYPKSDFVPDSYNAIGEYYFNNNNAFKALQAYKRAAQFPDSKIYTFALYKMAWCYYNVGEFGEAIETMKELVAETDRRLEANPEQAGISLKEEALRDLVLFFSEEGDLEAAKEYFTRYGEKRYYRKMLSRLGNIYMDQGKNELGIQTYRTLIAEQPFASDNPAHQNAIIKAYWDRDRFDEANEEIDKLVVTYGKESRWNSENADDKGALKESKRLIEKNLRNVAIDSHQQALKRRSAKLLLLAEENYKRYLDYFPKGGKSYEMRYWYAEVLYKLKKYDLATNEYEMTVESDAKGKFLKDAAINTIFSIEKYIGNQKKIWDRETKAERNRRKKLKDPKEKYAPIELREWESRLIKACDAYSKNLPDDEKTLNILYKAAYLLYEHNEFNLANDRFLQIIRGNPKSELAQFSVNIILDSYALIENWDDLNKVAREFHANPDVGKTTKFKADLKSIYQNATFKIAEGYAAGEKKKDASKAFEDFYREFEDAKIRDLALYNASFWAGQSGDKARMVALRTEFVENFPEPLGKETKTRQLFEKSVSQLGDHYQSMAAYGKAGTYYRTLFDADKAFEVEGFTTAQDALYNAALFAEALGDIDGATQHFRDYLATWPDGDDVLSTKMRVARMLTTAGKTDAAKNEWKAIYGDAGTPPAESMEARQQYGLLIGERKDQLSHFKSSLKYFDGVKANIDGGDLSRLYAAEMQFELLEPEWAEFAAISMPADKTAGKILKKKIEGLAGLEKKYVGVLELKAGEWGIAALYRIGTLYADFAAKLRGAPCPDRLDEDQCFLYKAGLEDRAYPVSDKAVDAFQKAREKSYELKLYTDYTAKAIAGLSDIRPEEFPPGAEEYAKPEYSSNPYVTADLAR